MAKQKAIDPREERVARICANINKGTFGGEDHNAVLYMGSRDIIQVRRFSSGCPDLDDALGGGWPKGRMAEVYGPESGGKTTLVLHAMAEHQKAFPDEDVGLIDPEYAFDESYAAAIGVDMHYVLTHQPEGGEQALNVLEQMIKEGVGLIVVDSVAALTTKAELEGDIGDIHMAEQARLMSQALRRLNTEAGKRGATILWTNQVRDKIGPMVWGDKTTTPAGRALKHYASIRLHVVRIGSVMEVIDGEKVAVSNKVRADVKKNKTAPPFRKAEFCISFGHGVDLVAAVLDGAIARKVLSKRGSWILFGDEQVGQGRQVALENIRNNPDMLKKISDALTAAKEAGVEPVEDEAMDFKRPKAKSDSVVRVPVKPDADAIDGKPEPDEGAVEVSDA